MAGGLPWLAVVLQSDGLFLVVERARNIASTRRSVFQCATKLLPLYRSCCCIYTGAVEIFWRNEGLSEFLDGTGHNLSWSLAQSVSESAADR